MNDTPSGPPAPRRSVARDTIFKALDRHHAATRAALKLDTLVYRTGYTKTTCIKYRREWRALGGEAEGGRPCEKPA